MIRCRDNVFVLDTENSTYAFKVLPSGQLEHLYYGSLTDVYDDLEAFEHKENNINGCISQYSSADPNFTLDEFPLEYSGLGKGDLRQPSIDIIFKDQTRTTDFIFESYEIKKGNIKYETLPFAKDEKDEVETLAIKLKDRNHNVYLEISYSVFGNDNIVRSTRLINKEDDLLLMNLMSNHLDFETNSYRFIHFSGDWTNEMNKNDIEIKGGRYSCESRGGSSSNRANPFVMIARKNAVEDYGQVYAFNLLYSGNHMQSIEVDGHGKMRFVSGINPSTLFYTVKKDEVFEAPQSVMTFSNRGFMGVRNNTHGFVNDHVLP